MKKTLLPFVFFLLVHLMAFGQAEERLKFVSVTPAVHAGQDYKPLLNDDPSVLVSKKWSSDNNRYIDVVLKFERKSKISRISLYDHEGIFTDKPAEIYALNGASRTLLGKFDGKKYLQWVDLVLAKEITADAIILHKYGNNIPQKIRAFGEPLGQKPIKVKAVISFVPAAPMQVGDAPFTLEATSTNTKTAIVFTSSNPAVVAVTKTGNVWKATAKSVGKANITASQGESNEFLKADDAVVEQIVEEKSLLFAQVAFKSIPGRVEAEDFDAMSGVVTQKTEDVGAGENLSSIGAGDWMEYNVMVAEEGTYKMYFRVSAKSASGQFEVRNAAGAVLSTVNVPATGGVQKWITLSTTTELPAGDQRLQIFSKRQGWNFNWFEGELIKMMQAPKEQAYISFAALPERTAGDAAFVLAASSSNTQTPITFTSSNPAVLAVSNEGGIWKAVPLAAGTVSVTASQVGSDAYNAAEDVVQTQAVKAAKVQAMITFPVLAERTAGDAAFALVASSNNTGTPLQFASSNPAVVAVTNESGVWMATPLAAGTADITASQAGNDGFLAASNVTRTQTIEAAKVQAVITFGSLAEKTAGDAAYILTASSSNTQTPITFSSSNPAVVAVTNEAGVWKAAPLAAGTASITASQVGDQNFLAAADAVQAQVVRAAKVQSVIAFAALTDKTAGDPAYNLVATSNNSQTPVTFASSNPAVVTVINEAGVWKATPVAVGTASITASQAASEGYLAAADVIQAQAVAPVVVPVPEKEPDLSRKSGKLTLADYKATWMYLAGPKPESQNYTKLMDGVLNEKIPLTWSTTLSPNNFFMTFPLGMEFTLEKFRIYDGDGTFGKPIRFYFIKRDASKPGGVDWTRIPGPVFYGERRLVWEEFAIAQPLDLYAIVIEFEQVVPGEIELTGSWKPFSPAPYTKKAISIDGSLRTNSYIWNIQQPSGRGIHEEKLEVLKAFKGVRDYVDWVKIEKVKGQYTFEPASEGGWRYDLVYERLKKEGIEVHACFKNQTPWSLAEFGYSPDNNYEYAVAPWTKLPYPFKPANATAEQTAQYNLDMANYNADIVRLREDPNSYAYFSKAAFQYAARYGANTSLNPELIKLASNQQKKIGLGYVRSIECNNETDAGWHGRKRFMTPREYAYFLSVFYDGHMNTMGPGIGIKNADPDMLVVAGGIADNRPAYFQGVIDAWKEIRGYKVNAKGEKVVNMACDIWNYHAYSNNGGGQFSNAAWGLPPEMSNMPVRVTDFLQVVSEVGNDLPVWITEVGYDVNESSQQALATPTRTKLQSHGDWMIRTILFNIRNGITETYFYQAYDESSYTAAVQSGKIDNRTYAASGLIREYKDENLVSKYERRPAAAYMKQLQLFKDFVHQKTISKDPFVDIYELKGDKMYALVVPDMVSRTAEYTLDLGGAAQAIVYRFVDGAEEFSITTVPTVGGKLTLTVTETPVFVTTAPVYAAASTATVASKLKEAVSLKDEQVELTAFPNPFTTQTTVQFTLTAADNASLKVYDLQGRVVRQIFSGAAAAGELKSFTLKAEGLAQGIYIVKLVTGSKTVTQKIVVGSGTVPAS